MADIKEIADKIRGAENILVALSKDPNVDEVSAALGLTLMLDKIGKKATAIYSGATPDVLKFLKPEDTFSADTNALQDFIIALDKEKADHLRYKVDGDYVKVFITPYRAAISEDDLEYSYGDFNVDLIVALDVANEKDLDGALIEYGRIMHDAGAVNITTSTGGNFSETEWSNPQASSVSEMVAELGTELGDDTLEKNSATALLTGVVASTERFANDKTTPETMGVAAKLMAAGADQKLIAENIERAEMGEEQVMLDEKPDEAPAEAGPETSEKPGEGDLEEAASETTKEPKEELGEVEQEEEPAELAEEPKEEPAEEKEELAEELKEKPDEDTVEEPAAELGESETEEPVEVKQEEQTEPAVEPQKPVLETPSELLAEMPGASGPAEESKDDASEEKPVEEPAMEPSVPEEKPAEEPVAEGSVPEENPAEEPKVENNESEEKPAEDEPKVEISKGGGISAPPAEDGGRRSVNLQPSAEAQAELEKIMHEEPKKNELLDELNKFSGEQAVSGGLKPDMGLSSIDTDSIGKTETKDYSEMMAAALEGDGGMPNPAVQAAPAVMTGPEANHIPDIDFSQATDTVAEQPPVMQNGMLEPVASDKPEGAAQEGMNTAVEPTPLAPGTTPAQEGMNGDILPPPPAPPVDGAMMPPGAEPVAPVIPAMPTVDTAAPEAAPAMPESTPAAPAMPEPAPAEPAMPAAIPAMPETPAAPTPAPETQAPTQVGPAPVNDDPTAFRIPGM